MKKLFATRSIRQVQILVNIEHYLIQHPSSLPWSRCTGFQPEAPGFTPQTLVSPRCNLKTLVSPRQNSVVTPSLVKNPDNPPAYPHLFDMRGVLGNDTQKYHPDQFFLPVICRGAPHQRLWPHTLNTNPGWTGVPH